MSRLHILTIPDYERGTLPPEGYLQWHAWAKVQQKAGLRQKKCPRCGLYRYPQEPCRKDGVCPK